MRRMALSEKKKKTQPNINTYLEKPWSNRETLNKYSVTTPTTKKKLVGDADGRIVLP